MADHEDYKVIANLTDHIADASAHHVRYSDAEARVLFSPMSIPPSSFVPTYDTLDWVIASEVLYNRSSLASQDYVSPVIFPDGVTVTKLVLFGYRNDAAAVMALFLRRVSRTGSYTNMAYVVATWTTGFSSFLDITISDPVIDNANYSYSLRLQLNPNDNVLDVRLTGATIEFTG